MLTAAVAGFANTKNELMKCFVYPSNRSGSPTLQEGNRYQTSSFVALTLLKVQSFVVVVRCKNLGVLRLYNPSLFTTSGPSTGLALS